MSHSGFFVIKKLFRGFQNDSLLILLHCQEMYFTVSNYLKQTKMENTLRGGTLLQKSLLLCLILHL